MSNVKASLKRKIGPLPVWAWAVITGIGIYVYRSRTAGVTGASSAGVTADQTAADSSGAGQLDPITLEPGQSAYNPNTGQLVSSAPEQLAPGDPVTLDPGQHVYDPGTGAVSGSDPLPGTKTGQKHKPPRHKPKAKPHGKVGKTASKPGNHKSKPRATGRILKPGRVIGSMLSKGKGTGHVPAKSRVRGTAATAHPSGSPRTRAKPAPATAIRQRPAGTHAVHPGTQKVGPHPGRAPVHVAAPAQHPQRARKRKR